MEADARHLTPRQRRERDYYEEYSRRHAITEVDFGPVLGLERRPWNPYWFVYEFATERFRDGARRTLDFGCGGGVNSVRLARLGYEVHGFDISPANVSRAQALAEHHGLGERTSFSVQTAEAIDYPDNHFDLVVGIDILHHVDVPRAVAECLRVLTPDGAAVFKEWREVPLLDRIRRSTPVRKLFPTGMSYDRRVTADEKKLTRADFAEIQKACPRLSIQPFMLISRFDEIIPPREGRPSILERIDRILFRALPVMGRFGGAPVLILSK